MSSINNKKVFIVHGRNTSVRNDVELFISRIGLEPIILCEQANRGMTIIEKIEANCDVSFSIVLYTGCDEGRLKGELDLNDRARQNVVFEHGYMVAHLGRANVVALTEEDIEIPGDMSGIIYISLQDPEWKQKVMKEMRAANLNFDWYKV
ncbi:nucleotide-binding protein [Clostridium estertheticum]|nr:nucleotide-binding protein [Clostridium estertheticum]WLC81982.1 nucleotide-binding protein [Clostridium estertheticum]